MYTHTYMDFKCGEKNCLCVSVIYLSVDFYKSAHSISFLVKIFTIDLRNFIIWNVKVVSSFF